MVRSREVAGLLARPHDVASSARNGEAAGLAGNHKVVGWARIRGIAGRL